MKTTVEMSDELFTELRVIAARERRKLRDVMEEVVSAGLRARRRRSAGGTARQTAAEAWLRDWQALGKRIEDGAVDERSCVEILLSDRR